MEWTAILAILAQVDWVQVGLIVLTILLFISELLGNIPQVKANSIYQLIMQTLPKIIEVVKKIQKPKKIGQNKKDKRENEEIDSDYEG